MSEKHWRNTIDWLADFVGGLAERSCESVRLHIRQRGDHPRWIASYNGFYLTRGHHSNNSSATLHDYASGKIAWFEHWTKHGKDGTSAGAEADMLDVVLDKAKGAGFNVAEIVTDKDSSVKSIYLKHYPEGRVTYCSNHCAKTLYKDLQKLKQAMCQVKKVIYSRMYAPITHCMCLPSVEQMVWSAVSG